MKTQPIHIIPVAILMSSLLSCANGNHGESRSIHDDITSTDTSAVSEPSGAALALNSPQRRLVHAASIHGQVAQLYRATSEIETMTMQLGGQVSASTLEKELHEARTEREGSDSLREFRRYSGVAILNLRVPVARLDTLLSYIVAQTSFIDNRQVRIDDKTFRHLDNAMRNRRLAGGGTTVEGASRADGLEARQYLDEQRGNAVSRQVENLQLDDQAAYANLSIELSQPDEVVSRVIPDINRLMQPGPWQRFMQSLRNGWELLYSIFIGILAIWPVVIVFIAGGIFLRRWHRRQQSSVRVIKS